MILLTKTEANLVRGHHVGGHALAPKPFKNDDSVPSKFKGMFGLPEEVLADPMFAPFHDILTKWGLICPDSDINQGVFDPVTDTWTIEPDWETDPALTAPHTYDESWPVGQIIVVP